jgi:hypothetical protein
MRRVLVVAMLALACGGSEDAPPPAATFDVLDGQAVCHQPDRAYHIRATEAVSLCEWDCATLNGETGFVQVGFGYIPNAPVLVMPIVLEREGCQ